MAREFISEYALDPEEYIHRFVDLCCDRCPKFSEQTVEEVIFVDDGPVEYLVWFALDDYETHTFFYHDPNPHQEFLQWLISFSPHEQEISAFTAFLREHYNIYRSFEHAALLELTDTYLPQVGQRPRANLGICHNPGDDRIISGISGTPRLREADIFEDADKIVPDKSLEKFVSKTFWTLNRQIEEDADRHMIEGNLRNVLEEDPAFRHETTKPLPSGVHPTYTNTEAELWQKPASQVDAMDGAQGFLQIWLPTTEDACALLNVTAGDYDRASIVDTLREKLEETVIGK